MKDIQSQEYMSQHEPQLLGNEKDQKQRKIEYEEEEDHSKDVNFASDTAYVESLDEPYPAKDQH